MAELCAFWQTIIITETWSHRMIPLPKCCCCTALKNRLKLKFSSLLQVMEKLGETEDIANMIYFLARKEAGFITGQIIGVNGGMVI